MRKIAVHDVLANAVLFESLLQKWRKESMATAQPFDPDSFELFLSRAEAFEVALASFDAPVSLAGIRGFLIEMRKADFLPEGTRVLRGQSLASAVGHLAKVSVLSDELEANLFLQISARAVPIYDQLGGLFGEEVDTKFPDAIEEISEAGKCLALGRHTACVFHVMRAMEIGVSVAGCKLDATVQDTNGETLSWGKIVANLKLKIDNLSKGKRQDEWYKLHALLHSVNRAYRTKTAHPEKSYDRGEAENAFNATKAFMQHLAFMI